MLIFIKELTGLLCHTAIWKYYYGGYNLRGYPANRTKFLFYRRSCFNPSFAIRKQYHPQATYLCIWNDYINTNYNIKIYARFNRKCDRRYTQW